MVVLLISLVVVVAAIVVVLRLLLAELARAAAYRPSRTQPTANLRPVNLGAPKGGLSAPPSAAPTGMSDQGSSPARAADLGEPREAPVAVLEEADPTPAETSVEGEDEDEEDHVAARDRAPRRRDVGRVARVHWWKRLRSGVVLALLVATIGVAVAATIGAIALFIVFTLDRAVS